MHPVSGRQDDLSSPRKAGGRTGKCLGRGCGLNLDSALSLDSDLGCANSCEAQAYLPSLFLNRLSCLQNE
jgi:hypothetical protein